MDLNKEDDKGNLERRKFTSQGLQISSITLLTSTTNNLQPLLTNRTLLNIHVCRKIYRLRLPWLSIYASILQYHFLLQMKTSGVLS